jgi:hypothetical protein
VEKDAVRTTIVGGRPPGSGQDVGAVPRGIEVLVKKASVDPAFKGLLLQKRAGAAQEIGLQLEPAEALMLASVPAAQLDAIIARTKVGVYERRAFLGTAAAAMLAALSAVRAEDDGKATSRGVKPDRPATGDDPSKAALQEHEEARKQQDAGCVVFTTWFPAKAMHAAVDSKGQRQLIKSGMAFAIAPLNEPNLKALLATLPKLPEGQAAKALADVLTISWREGEAWKTRQYNRAALPAEVAAIFMWLGMPENRPQNLPPGGARPDRPGARE